MSWRDEFYIAVGDYLRNRSYSPITDLCDVYNVVGYPESTGGCTTCGPDPAEVVISYTDNKGACHTSTMYMDLSDFLNTIGD